VVGREYLLNGVSYLVVENGYGDYGIKTWSTDFNWSQKIVTTRVTDMNNVFYYANFFTTDIGNWDVSNVLDMNHMFYKATSFNAPIGNWDVSNVTDMSYMFYQGWNFKADIGNWDVSNVTDMNTMFFDARTFKADIGNWDVSNVTNMYQMFYKATAFNAPLINWDVNKATLQYMGGMYWMFYQANALLSKYSANVPLPITPTISAWKTYWTTVGTLTSSGGNAPGSEGSSAWFSMPANYLDIKKIITVSGSDSTAYAVSNISFNDGGTNIMKLTFNGAVEGIFETGTTYVASFVY
jgi:surface protein